MKAAVTLFVLGAVTLCAVQCVLDSGPDNGLRMPDRWRLITWDKYIQTLHPKSSLLYILFPNPDIPIRQRYTTYLQQIGSDSLATTIVYRSIDGTCIQEERTGITHTPGEKYAITRIDDYMEAVFSSDPASYVWGAGCFNASTIVDGVCMGGGAISLLASEFPPDHLDWGKVACDLRRVMGLKMTDNRFKFIGVGEGCPDPNIDPS